MSAQFLWFCLLVVDHVGARFYSGRVVPPGRNEYLNSSRAAEAWTPEEAVEHCERDLECAGFTLRWPLKSGGRHHVTFFR